MSTTDLLPAGPMARSLRVPVGWIKAEADAGRLPHIRAGKIYLFHPGAVARVLADRAAQPATAESEVQHATQ